MSLETIHEPTTPSNAPRQAHGELVPGEVFTPEQQAQRLVEAHRLTGRPVPTIHEARRHVAELRRQQHQSIAWAALSRRPRTAFSWRVSPHRRVPAPSRTAP